MRRYDGPSVKEQIKTLFSSPYFGGRKLKKLSSFFFWGGERIKNFLFSLPFWGGEKIKKKVLFSLPFYRRKENIFQAMTGCLAHFPIGIGSYHYIK